jgi:hypothetical protein
MAGRIYDSERLLFAAEAAEGGPPGWRGLLALLRPRARAPHAPATYLPLAFAPGEALALFAVCALLLLGPGVELQAYGLGGLSASLWVCLAIPVTLAARWRLGSDAAVGLGLRKPRPRHLWARCSSAPRAGSSSSRWCCRSRSGSSPRRRR